MKIKCYLTSPSWEFDLINQFGPSSEGSPAKVEMTSEEILAALIKFGRARLVLREDAGLDIRFDDSYEYEF